MSADYPKLVRPEILRELNDEVFSALRLPLFLNTAPLPLYALKESKNSFPGLAAMLYCIYNDYSKGLLEICVKKKYIPYCLQKDSTLLDQRKNAEEHYNNICYLLRNGFYHGYYPEHELGIKFPDIIESYTGASSYAEAGDVTFHKKMQSVARGGWEIARIKLIEEADKLYLYIKEWKKRMAELDQRALDDCRNKFINGLFSKFWKYNKNEYEYIWIDGNFMIYILNGILLGQGKRREIKNQTYKNSLMGNVGNINRKLKAKILAADGVEGFEKPEHVHMGLIDMIEKAILGERKLSRLESEELKEFDIPL